eukprot:98012-Rhodomonas_salina.2
MVGSYQWLLTMTRTDLGFVVSELSQFLANPGKEHMDAAVQVLLYLKETRLLGLKYNRDGGGLKGYSYSDCASCQDTHKSVGGFVFKYTGAAVSWKCKCQHVVALSTVEAEYIAASKAEQEAIYLQRILLDLGEEILEGCMLHEDNEGCINLDGHVRLVRCRMNEMTADMMTKALSGPAL